ncbi:MAG: DUF2752 domain-containing protein [Clostridium sp.]|nr:DUF2752 domain-containing protein [Clostridium sp.]
MKREKTLEDRLFFIGMIFLALGGVAGFLFFRFRKAGVVFPGCFWNRRFGIYCPGCGGTRAIIAFLRGHWLLSVWYHPVVPYTAVLFGSFMITQAFARVTKYRYGRGMRFHSWFLYGAILVVAVHFITKNSLRLLGYAALS